MNCLIKSMFTKELELYTNILGSEAAAYYVLSMNNGNTLDKDLYGNPSTLWQDILSLHNGNESIAVLIKSQIYTPEFLKRHNNWTETTGIEPMITDIKSTNSVDDILGGSYYSDLMLQLGESDQSKSIYCIREAIKKSEEEFVLLEKNSKIKPVEKRTFFLRMAYIFTIGMYNHKKVLLVDKEEEKQVDNAARLVFYQTLRHNILLKLCGLIKNNVSMQFIDVANVIDYFEKQNDNYRINNAINILYKIIHDNFISTISDKGQLRVALLMFENTLLVQDGLRIFGSIDRLRDALIKSYDANTNKLNYINLFWVRFNQEICRQFVDNKQNGSIDDIQSEFGSSPDITNCIDMYNALGSDIKNQDEAAFDFIYGGLKSRLESVKRRRAGNRNLIFLLETKIRQLKLKNSKDLGDVYLTWLDFLLNAQADLLYVQDWINLKKSQPASETDPSELMYLSTDVIGYYSSVALNFLVYLRTRSNMGNELIEDIIEQYNTTIKDNLATVIDQYNTFLYNYTKYTIDKYIDDNVDIGDKERFKHNAMLWLQNQNVNGGIGAMERFLGLAQDSKSPIIRIMDSMLQDANMEKQRFINKLGHELMKQYKDLHRSLISKIGPKNYQLMFVQLDRDGKSTGYWIDPINKGLFYKDLNDKKLKLIKTYGLQDRLDGNGNPVFDYSIDSDVDLWRLYNLDLNDWLGQHCHRQYTSDYYELRYRILTPLAIEALDELLDQINLYYDKCRNKDGVIDTRLLTPFQKNKLDELLREKDSLSNPYNVLTDPTTGKIISFSDKTGDELSIAESILRFLSAVKGKIKQVPDTDAFNSILNSITDPVEKQAFINANTDSLVISSEFWDRVLRAGRTSPSSYGAILNAKRAKISGYTKQSRGYVMPDLTKLNDEAFLEIKRIEEESLLLKRYSKPSSGEQIDEFATEIPIRITLPSGLTITALDYFRIQAQLLMVTNPNAMREFEEKYYKDIYARDKNTKKIIIDPNTGKPVVEKRAPLSIFYMLVPNMANQHYILHNVPTGAYTKLDEDSPFVDSHFDKTKSDRLLARDDEYLDERWYKFGFDDENSDVRKLLDKLKEIMKEANSKIPLGERYNDGRMPLITADKLRLIQTKGIGSVISDALNVNEKDEEIFLDYATRPDGTKVQSVPVRFVRMLQDPSKISTDVIGSVLLYAEMAENYNQKKDVVSNLEATLLLLKGGINGKNSNDHVQRADSLIDMYGYGNMTTFSTDRSKKLTKLLKNWIKRVGNILYISTMAMLSKNLFSAAKGFLSAFSQTAAESLVGKYYSKSDYSRACAICIKEIPNALNSIGKANTTSKILAAMQHNGLARSFQESFGNSDRTLVTKLMSDHLMMGEYSIGDYMTNGVVMVAVYQQYKLVEDPRDRELKFMNEDEYVYACTQINNTEYTANKAIRDFKNSNRIRLWDAYELNKENGDFVAKAGYEKYITKKLENRIANTVSERASIINGVSPHHGKPIVYQNYISRLVTVMRGYMFSLGWDKMKGGNDYVIEWDNKPGSSNYEIKLDDKEYNGQYNFMTGRVERGLFKSLLKTLIALRDMMNNSIVALKSIKAVDSKDYRDRNTHYSLSRMDRKNIKRMAIDVALIGTMCALTLLTRMLKDDYPDSWLANFTYLINLGMIAELSTGYNPFTLMDIVQNVTTLQSYLTELSKISNILISIGGFSVDLFIGNHEDSGYFSQPISTGQYLGHSKFYRDIFRILLKPTGITNFLENTGLHYEEGSGFKTSTKGLESKIKYYSEHVSPLNTPLVRTKQFGSLYSGGGDFDFDFDFDTDFDVDFDF